MTKGNVRRRLAFFRLGPCATSTGTHIGQCVEKTEQKKRGGWKLVGEADWMNAFSLSLFWSKGQRNALVLSPWPTFFQPRRPSETRFQFPFFTRRPLFLSLSTAAVFLPEFPLRSRPNPFALRLSFTSFLFCCFTQTIWSSFSFFFFSLYIKHFWKL